MRAGSLRHKIELQSAQYTQDSYGEPIAEWSTYAYVSASIEPLSGRELEVAKQIRADVSHKIGLRYVCDVKPIHRVKFGERIFNIVSVLNREERNIELALLCTEGV